MPDIGLLQGRAPRPRAVPPLIAPPPSPEVPEVDEAIAAGADRILVDNMATTDIRVAVRRIEGRATVEISGGVTLDRMAELSTTGADFISIGALTHSAPAIDISFEIEPV